MVDFFLACVLLFGGVRLARPLIDDLLSVQKSQEVISTLSSAVDATHDDTRMEQLRDAQTYNITLGGDTAHTDNAGFHGGNGGTEDILELANSDAENEALPYDDELVLEGSPAMSWIEIESIGVNEPIYHGTEEGVLSMGAGHLEQSSLPVGGASSHCIICAHSGMQQRHMFDDLELLKAGDRFVLHTLGDAYAYEVYQIETLLPEEAMTRCAIEPGRDLCTLITCTPYGINSHRLLVHGERVPFDPSERGQSATAPRILTRRTTPLIGYLGGCIAVTALCAAGHCVFGRKRKRGKEMRIPCADTQARG